MPEQEALTKALYFYIVLYFLTISSSFLNQSYNQANVQVLPVVILIGCFDMPNTVKCVILLIATRQ